MNSGDARDNSAASDPERNFEINIQTPAPASSDTQAHFSIAKITRPKTTGILPRKRLFEQLDACLNQPVTWISAPAGSGKTTLAASYLSEKKIPHIWYRVDEGDGDIASFFYYLGLAVKKAVPDKTDPLPLLTPEYMLGIPTFTLRYFENLYSRMSTPFVIVFDNYQCAPAQSQIHELIHNGLDILVEGISSIFISRENPPPQFARLRVNGKMVMLKPADIRFDLQETKDMIRMKGLREISDESVRHIHERTKGWAAGLVLMMETATGDDVIGENLSGHTQQELFDYFATEIFEKTDKEIRNFLLRTAFLPRMTAHMAGNLYGVACSGEILTRLSRDHFFTEKDTEPDPFYQYHPLFREFLTTKAKEDLTPDEIAKIQRNAAALLVAVGQVESAAELLIDVGDWDGFVPFLLGNAPVLMAQGRVQTLANWLSAIPREITDTTPWLLYWLGTCQKPAEGRAFFELAFRLFNEQGDEAGSLMAWSGAVESLVFEFDDFRPVDRWIDWLDERLQQTPSFPTTEIEAAVAVSMTGALVWRRPDHPLIAKWVSRALSVSPHDNGILRLKALFNAAQYYAFRGDFIRGKIVVEELGRMAGSASALPLYRIYSKAIEAYFNISILNDPERILEAIEEGLRVAVESGVHIMDHMLLAEGAYGALGKRDTALSGQYLKKMEATLVPLHVESNPREGASNNRPYYRAPYVVMSHYYYVSSLHYYLECDMIAAEAAAEKALAMTEAAGITLPHAMCQMVSAQIAFEKGDYQRAFSELDATESYILRTGAQCMESACHLIRAYFNFSMGKEIDGARALSRGMGHCRQKGYTDDAPLLWRPPAMTRLCTEALKAGIEVEYVQDLIRKKRLVPDARAMELENWPWPVKVFTLGGFRLVLDGQPVSFSGKVPRKPLDLLKCLIALGGKDVKEEQLTDLLWHESDGDQAHSAFATNLSRLRRLLGPDEAIELKGGRVSLNPRCCLVDVWSFEETARSVESQLKKPNASGKRGGDTLESLLEMAEKSMGAYGGPFLSGEGSLPWLLPLRKRLQTRFCGLVVGIGSRLEAAEQWESEVEYYQKALDKGEIADEEIYRRLMICHNRLGRPDRAIEVYHQCRKSLAIILGSKPSVKTEAVYRALTM